MIRSPAILLLLGLTGFARIAATHPQHRTTAQVEVNAEQRVLEVGLRVHLDDLAKALNDTNAKPVRRDNRSIEPEVVRYIGERFRLHQKEKPSTAKWVGHEQDGADLWLYFELPFIPGAATLSNRAFFELFRDQVNVVQLREGSQKRTVTLTRKSEPLKLELP